MASIASRMAEIYSRGPMSRIIAADGIPGIMNLGYNLPSESLSQAERQRRLLDMIAELLDPRPGELVLDLGCGKGGAMAHLLRRYPEANIIGLNIDSCQLSYAKNLLDQAGFKGSELIAADALSLPFRNDSLSMLYTIELISHIADKRALFAEIRRVLRPRGTVAVVGMTLNRPYKQFDSESRTYLRRVASFFDEDPAHFGTIADYLEGFADHGFALQTNLDLTDGVFPSRYCAQLAALAELRNSREPPGLSHPDVEMPNRDLLINFLETNTERHPCRFYEYHLGLWQKTR